jgi:hypothetical protein
VGESGCARPNASHDTSQGRVSSLRLHSLGFAIGVDYHPKKHQEKIEKQQENFS